MIPKLVLSNSYDFGECSVNLVRLHSRGVDSNWMLKHAGAQGVFGNALSDLKPMKGKTVVHVIALGDEEIYGANRNCDSFAREDNKRCHKTFVDLGHVFKNHQNSDPSKSFGEVLNSAHNDIMDRVELLLALNDKKCGTEINALERGEEVPLSMGSLQDYDVCSHCGHKAPTAKEHCSHIKDMLGEVLEGGQRIYMQNPNPKFFDISIVHKPADRIAYTLRKVASANGIVGGHDLAEEFGIRSWSSPKTATIIALADIRKQLPISIRKAPGSKTLSKAAAAGLREAVVKHGVHNVIGHLIKNAQVLSAEDFADIIVGHPNPKGCVKAAEEQEVLSDILDDQTEIGAFEPDCDNCVSLEPHVEQELTSNCSMEAAPVQNRTITIIIAGKPPIKEAASLDEAEARGFATLYAHYKIAVAHRYNKNYTMLRAIAATL